MSSAIELYTASGVSDTTTTLEGDDLTNLMQANGDAANFFVSVTAAAASTSVWTITCYALTPDGAQIELATVTGVDAETTGATEIAKNAAFTGTNDCVPMPDRIVLTRTTGPGDLTAKICAFLAR